MQSDIYRSIISYIKPLFDLEYPGQPLVTENAPFDHNNAPSFWVELEVEFHDGSQANIAADPKTRYYGCIYVSAYCREGTGALKAWDALDWFADTLKYKTIGLIQVQEPRPDGKSEPKGWHVQHLRFDFYSKPT